MNVSCRLARDAAHRENVPGLTEPAADAEDAVHEYGVTLTPFEELPRADALVAAVVRRECQALSVEDLGRKMVKGGAFIDVKAVFDQQALAAAGYLVWRL